VLFKEWQLGEQEAELTVMRVTGSGHEAKGKPRREIYELYDEYDPLTETSSMARTTGYTATAAVNLVMNGMITRKGIIAPEEIGGWPACFDYLLKHLEKRGVTLIRR
jgi:lysine 6-dehydrogenase